MLRVFIGENTLARDNAYKDFINNFVKEHGQMAVDVLQVDSLSLNDCIDAVTTVPFLSAKRCVVLKYVSQNKEISDNFEKIIKRSADTTDIVVIEGSLDSRLNYSKFIKKYADDLQTFDVLDGGALLNWVVNNAKEQGISIEKSVVQLLIDKLGPNQLLVANELNKLSLVNGGKITKELVESFVVASPQSSVFSMLDAVTSGNVSLVTKLYKEQRDQGVEPQEILGMIAWQLSVLSIVVFYKNESPNYIAKEAKISPYVVRKNLPIAKKLSKEKLVALLDLSIKADYLIKTNKVKPDGAVLALLIELAQTIKSI